jgi:hypothetical protein
MNAQTAQSKGEMCDISLGYSADIVDRVAEVGLRPANDDELDAARGLAAGLIGSDIATVDTLRAVQAATGASILVTRDSEGVAGVLAALLVRPRGRAQIEAGCFDGVGVDLDLLARPGETPAAFYAWGIASRSREASRAVVAGAAELSRLFATMPRFARAATEAGARILTARMGYLPVCGAPNLYWLPAEVVQ